MRLQIILREHWAIIAFVTVPAYLFLVSCLDGIYLRLQWIQACVVYTDGVYGLSLAPTLVPDLYMALVFFKLEGLYLILVKLFNKFPYSLCLSIISIIQVTKISIPWNIF